MLSIQHVLTMVLCLALSGYCYGVIHSFRASTARGTHVLHMRSNATSKNAVYLDKDESISFYFCLRQNTSISVTSLRYSNGNQAEVCSVFFDDAEVGTVTTNDTFTKGDNWNKFFSSGNIGLTVLEKGWHILKIMVHGSDGIELDTISLDMADDKLTPDILACKLQCLSNLPYRKLTPNANVYRNATLSQKSYPTLCAEEDNVKVAVYLDDVEEYKISASLPLYKTFKNRRDENTTNCGFLPNLYWRFTDVDVTNVSQTVNSSSASMTVLGQPEFLLSFHHIQIMFTLQGREKGYIDADIGSVLSLSFKPVPTTVVLYGSFKGRRERVSYLRGVTLTAGKREITWEIPDFSWSDVKENVISIGVHSLLPVPLFIEDIQLQRRGMKQDQVIHVYKSDDIIIEGLRVDFWWRAPESMTLWVEDINKVFYDVNFFRISLPVPWADGYAQVFVLYQDGNVRLLPLPPSGLDWIPFGSSVVVGTSNPNLKRPSASIHRVDINPDKREMVLHYNNGEKAKLKLISKLDKTELIVSDLRFQEHSRIFPFATVRSMYVEEGNTDCDSVMVDESKVFGIMDKWGHEQGRSFNFFRKCESKHLTLSPDIRLDITRTRKPTPLVSNQWWQSVNNTND